MFLAGHLCPALPGAIKTMKRGEKVKLVVQPQRMFLHPCHQPAMLEPTVFFSKLSETNKGCSLSVIIVLRGKEY